MAILGDLLNMCPVPTIFALLFLESFRVGVAHLAFFLSCFGLVFGVLPSGGYPHGSFSLYVCFSVVGVGGQIAIAYFCLFYYLCLFSMSSDFRYLSVSLARLLCLFLVSCLSSRERRGDEPWRHSRVVPKKTTRMDSRTEAPRSQLSRLRA